MLILGRKPWQEFGGGCGKWGISEDELFEKMGINPKVEADRGTASNKQEYWWLLEATIILLHGYVSSSPVTNIHCAN